VASHCREAWSLKNLTSKSVQAFPLKPLAAAFCQTPDHVDVGDTTLGLVEDTAMTMVAVNASVSLTVLLSLVMYLRDPMQLSASHLLFPDSVSSFPDSNSFILSMD
jgi:hypothetical protein